MKLIFRRRHLKVDKKENNRTESPSPAVLQIQSQRVIFENLASINMINMIANHTNYRDRCGRQGRM